MKLLVNKTPRRIALCALPMAAAVLLLLPMRGAAQVPQTTSPQYEAWLTREVRHELLMLPWYSVFDILEYKVNGTEVTLMGQVLHASLKSDAENVVKHLEGVSKVINDIEILPPSPMDNRIRHQEYRAIYSAAGLSRYAWGSVQAIHIIVKNGRVTLIGEVATQGDKDLAGLRAKTVPGTFSVQNDLRVVADMN